MDDEMISLRDYVDQRFDDQSRAVDAALVSAEKAVDKAELENRRWREAANEWRGAMTDRERDFLSRKEFYAIISTAVVVLAFAFGVFRAGVQ